MRIYLLIALGGSMGAMARFAVINWVSQVLGRAFPFGTLAVNVIGSGLPTAEVSPFSRISHGNFDRFSGRIYYHVHVFNRFSFID